MAGTRNRIGVHAEMIRNGTMKGPVRKHQGLRPCELCQQWLDPTTRRGKSNRKAGGSGDHHWGCGVVGSDHLFLQWDDICCQVYVGTF